MRSCSSFRLLQTSSSTSFSRLLLASDLGSRLTGTYYPRYASVGGIGKPTAIRYNHSAPQIATLDPGKLTSACFRDFSDTKQVALCLPQTADAVSWIKRRKRYVVDGPRGNAGGTAFPEKTRGFLYYRAPPCWAHDLAGDIRFRVTLDEDPARFRDGHDLVVKGVPWIIPLLPCTPLSAAFHGVLLRDGSLTPDQVRRLQRFPSYHRGDARRRLINSVGQPFIMWINPDKKADSRISQWVLGNEDGEDVMERLLLHAHPGTRWAYANRAGMVSQVFREEVLAVVHFEPWTRPKFEEKRYVRLRVRRLMRMDGSAVESEDDHPDYRAAGGLLCTVSQTRRRIWHHDLERGSEAWRHLRVPPDGVVMEL